jgi:hypothetical protein
MTKSRSIPATRDAQLARYWELRHAIDLARGRIAPLREKHDAFVNEAREKAQALADKMHAEETDVLDGLSMGEAMNEMAFLARGLVTVGEDPNA